RMVEELETEERSELARAVAVGQPLPEAEIELQVLLQEEVDPREELRGVLGTSAPEVARERAARDERDERVGLSGEDRVADPQVERELRPEREVVRRHDGRASDE